MHAVELINDRVGDDDGLCESDEACAFAPNLGAYQGQGALLGLVYSMTARSAASPCSAGRTTAAEGET
jgi:hypothetical protein